MNEMNARGYKTDPQWDSYNYRGKYLEKINAMPQEMSNDFDKLHEDDPGWKKIYAGMKTVYPEHDDFYLKECLENLDSKGAELVNGESISHMLLILAVMI